MNQVGHADEGTTLRILRIYGLRELELPIDDKSETVASALRDVEFLDSDRRGRAADRPRDAGLSRRAAVDDRAWGQRDLRGIVPGRDRRYPSL
jgi:hypothetical protein